MFGKYGEQMGQIEKIGFFDNRCWSVECRPQSLIAVKSVTQKQN